MQTIQDRNIEKQYHDDGGNKNEEPRGPSDTEAFNALEDAVELVQRQDSADRIQLLHLKISTTSAAAPKYLRAKIAFHIQ